MTTEFPVFGIDKYLFALFRNIMKFAEFCHFVFLVFVANLLIIKPMILGVMLHKRNST